MRAPRDGRTITVLSDGRAWGAFFARGGWFLNTRPPNKVRIKPTHWFPTHKSQREEWRP
jgi:hypothetical protein